MTATLPPCIKFQPLAAGVPLPGGKVNFYLAGTATPTTVFASDGITPIGPQLVLDANGSTDFRLDPAVVYKIDVLDASDVPQLNWPVDQVRTDFGLALAYVDALKADLANSADVTLGDALVTVKQVEAGSVATTQHKKNSESLHAVNDFECDNTGATNCTTQLLAFYNACILSKKRGHIPAGDYKITTGVLIFDNNQVETGWPDISTDGYKAVRFLVDAATATNAPILQWKNGTPAAAVTNYWKGGSHGGITIMDATGAAAASRHGISLTGVWGIRFGYVRGDGIRGSLINVPANLYGGTNPDPYAASLVAFDGIECNSGARYGIENLNFVGMDSWKIKSFRVVGNTLGGWFGVGSGCDCGEFVVANCNGWAFDDGTNGGAAGGSPQRNCFGVAEIDNVENGIRLNKSSITTFNKWRFVHRFQTSPNVSANYWPRIAIDLCAGSSPNVNKCKFDIFHRIEAGGVLANLGTFLDGHINGNVLSNLFDFDYADNGALGVTDSLLFSNMPTNAPNLVTRRTRRLWDTTDKCVVVAQGSNAVTSIPNSGYNTAGAVITMASTSFAPFTNPWVLGTNTFTAPRRGVYEFTLKIPMTMAVGTRLRFGFYHSVSGVMGTVYSYQNNAGIQTHVNTHQIFMNAGETVKPMADQNTAGALSVTPNFNGDECLFTVKEL